jgi:hypothetical protein
MSEEEQSLIPRLQRAYRQLRKSRLVKKTDPRQTDDEALEHFVSILNAALPRPGDPAEELADKVIKLQYFSNPRGFIRGLHRKNAPKNARQDARCLVLLTIGLEIVREFELEKVIHLHWNDEAREYDIEVLSNSHTSPTARERIRRQPQPTQTREEVEQLQETVRRLEAEMARIKSATPEGSDAEAEAGAVQVDDGFAETKNKSWAEMADGK